jgi:BASS family bile acid:Na+ symporter
VRSLLAMNVITPLLAVLLAVALDLNPAVEVALIALALSPVPPLLPKKEIKAGGAPSYTIGLLVTTALVSIVFVPAAAAVLRKVFGRPLDIDIGVVVHIVATSVLLPLLAGLVFKRIAPTLAAKASRPLSMAATVLLVAAALPILIKEWPAIRALVGNFSVIAIAAFSLVGLVLGHVLGGPDPDDRTVLALSTSTRHPAMALAIAHDMPDKQGLVAAVLLVTLVGAIVSAIYVRLHARRRTAALQRSDLHDAS